MSIFAEHWRSAYGHLREEGGPRWTSWLLATGVWAYWPFHLLFPEAEVTKTGRVLTRKDFERLADEAEQGYDLGEQGHANGWNIRPVPFRPGWQWSAYGPIGSDQGTAATEGEARQKAIRSHERLCRTGR